MNDAPGAPPRGPEDARSPRTLLAALLLAVATFALYSPAFSHAFIESYDDGAYVTLNPKVAAGLSPAGVAWAFTEFHSANWHPLTWLSHMLDVELFGLDAGAHHRTGALLHALGSGLCLLGLVALTRRFWASLVVAALFAVHPLRVESVAWVAERKDVLSGVFFFATLLAYAGYARRPSPRLFDARYLAVLVLFVLGLMAKPMLVTLPFVLLLLDLWPLRRTGARASLVLEKVPLFVLAAAACVVTVLAQRAGDAVRTFEAIPLGARVVNSVEAYALYIGKAAWPADLAFFYPHRVVASESGVETGVFTFVAGGLLLGITAGALLLRRSRAVLVGWLWFLGMLVPVIGIVQVGAQEMADRYAYLPLVGVTLAVVFGLEEGVRDGRARRGLLAAGLVAVGACVPLTLRQIAVWRDSVTLYEHALAVTERNYLAHTNLGYELQKQGDRADAREHYEAALAIRPLQISALTNLGGLLYELGELEAARARFARALSVNPEFREARLGLLLVQGALHLAGGRPEAAVATFEEASALAPDDPLVLTELGNALAAAGREREALSSLQRAAAAHGPPPLAVEALAWLRATSPDGDVYDPARALELARLRAGLEGCGWRCQRVLAAALAAGGDFAAARSTVANALAEAPAEERDELGRMLETFRGEEPYRR